MEEGFPEGLNYQDILQVRLQYDKVMDVQDAHTKMGPRHEYWNAKNLDVSSVWQWAAKFTLALIHEDERWWDIARANDYIRKRLGRDKDNGGDSLLAELLPLPRHSNNIWPKDYEQFFSEAAVYEEKVLPSRITALRDAATSYHPRYLFCYGSKYYRYYKDLAGNHDWDQELIPKKVWIKTLNDTKVILTPFWGNGAFSTETAKQIVKHLKRA